MEPLVKKYAEFKQSHPEMTKEQLKKYSYGFLYADALIETLNLKYKWGLK
jgi:hypothetical protein